MATDIDLERLRELFATGAQLVEVLPQDEYTKAHLPGAINLPHAKIIGSRLAAFPAATLFVVYCAGPHCNGAQRAALRLARLGRPVKIMLGGMSGWRDENFEIAQAPTEAATP